MNVPKFDGSADADPCEFFSKYRAFTSIYTDRSKYQGMNVALTGSAYRWLRSVTKKECDEGDWATLKRRFKERFYPSHSGLAHIQRLRDLKYEPEGNQTLVSFTEDYILAYKKAHNIKDPLQLNQEKDIIINLYATLPNNTKGRLNNS